MGLVPRQMGCHQAVSERRGGSRNVLEDLCLKVKALTVLYVPYSLDSGHEHSSLEASCLFLALDSSDPGGLRVSRIDPTPFTLLDEGSYLRLIDSCITQITAQGPARTCNESEEDCT